MERSINSTGPNSSTNGNILSFRFIVLFLFGIATSVVAQHWPRIVEAMVPTIDQLCGPVPPGWSSTDHPAQVIVAEAPYWLPTNNTDLKHHVFQIICGTDRLRNSNEGNTN